MTTVQTDNVSVSYGRTSALQDFSVTLRPGVTALLGKNGAGKSTLLKLLSTSMPLHRGDILVDAQSLRSRTNLSAYRKLLGVLPQHFGYIPHMSVIDFLDYCGWLQMMNSANRRQRIAHALERVGLSGSASTKMRRLSGGMVQRVGIASAIMGDPKVLLLDEPTVGLDVTERARFRTLLSELQEDAIVLISTHLVDDVVNSAGRVIILADGQCKYEGSTDALIEIGRTRTPDSSRVEALEAGYEKATNTVGRL